MLLAEQPDPDDPEVGHVWREKRQRGPRRRIVITDILALGVRYRIVYDDGTEGSRSFEIYFSRLRKDYKFYSRMVAPA